MIWVLGTWACGAPNGGLSGLAFKVTCPRRQVGLSERVGRTALAPIAVLDVVVVVPTH